MIEDIAIILSAALTLLVFYILTFLAFLAL